MKLSYNWLREHIALELPVAELSNKLLALGFEVAGVEKRGPAFKGVVTAKVLETTKHPNADRLKVCVVDAGTQKFSVVCGAPNVAAGQTVALAMVGAELPGGRKLTPAKIRGVESQGMICSAQELGLSGGPDGILVLGEGTPVGQDFAATLGPGDDILEVEITPNRPDCLSHRGLARELSAALSLPLKPLAAPPLPSPSGECFPITIEDQKACPLYVGRLITGVKVGPSPGWLAAKLESIGLRPINNIVDVTNYVMFDLGQPMHAFDASRLTGPEVRVRWARSGESIKALDGKSYALSSQNLLISDSERAVAIAGVMGGEESAVTEKTTSVLLESAYFAPPVVRKSSQHLKLKSDSSYRFERGTDPEFPVTASERAAGLIAQVAGKGVQISQPRTAGAALPRRPAIRTSAARLNAILGSSFSAPDIDRALCAIAAKLETQRETITFHAPSHRPDLETQWDLAEEAARLLGYDKIPTEAAPIPLVPAELTRSEAVVERCRRRLSGFGLLEAYTYDFSSAKALERARLDPAQSPALANPLSDDWTHLRPTLLIGLLDSALRNLNHGAASVRLFEVGKQYALVEGRVEERPHAAGILLGGERHWKRSPEADFYDAKGLVSELLSGVPALSWTPLREAGTKLASDGFFHPGAALRLQAVSQAAGTVGQLHPALARAWGFERQTAVLFDLDLDVLAAVNPPRVRFTPFSPFPGAWRDISVVAPLSRPFGDLEAAVREAGQPELQTAELIDVFAGKGLPERARSLTLRLTFASLERTLNDSEVNAAVDRILKALSSLGATLRAS